MGVHPQEVEASSELVIVGLEAIGQVFNRHCETISRWVSTEGFPAAQLPDDTYVTTPTLINEWLRSRCRAQERRSNGARKVLGV